MSLETDFNQSPYFDDYKAVAEDKDYHRILFRPGLAVQARELTQVQSILQEQVKRVGDNLYEEGTIIEGCAFQYDANVAFVRLQDRDRGGNTVNVSVFANGIVQGLTSGVRAKVMAVKSGSQAQSPATNVLMVKYIDGGTSRTNKTFALNEELSYLVADGGNCQLANTMPADAFGFGSIFAIGAGIVYGKGHLIRVRGQNTILEPFSTEPTYQLGFKITESIVDHTTDDTLLDNARGSYNYTAPGANRLKLTANLVKRVPGVANTESFTSLFEVTEGLVTKKKPFTVYDELDRQMAHRTYEESGNYIVEPINTIVKEHLDTTVNFGRYTSTENGDKNKLAVGIEPGVAYVMGYRNEVLNTEWVSINKATTTKEETSVSVTTNYGNYVDAVEVVGPWDPTTYQTVSLRNAKASAINGGEFGLHAAPGSEIGTAKLRFVDYVSGTAGRSDGKYRFYLFDVQMTSGEFSQVQGLYVNNATGPDSHADLVSSSPTLQEPSFNRNLYDTGLKAVQQLTNSSNTINTTYPYRDKASVTFNTGGVATLNMSGAHAGGSEELNYGTGSLNDTQKGEFQIVLNADAETANYSETASISGNTITLSGSISHIVAGDFIKITDGVTDSSLLKVESASGSQIVTTPQSNVTGSGRNYFKVYPAGSIIDMQGEGTAAGTLTERTITLPSALSATLNIQETIKNSVTATVFFNAKRESASGASKIVRRSRFVKLDLSSHTAGTAGPWTLGFADVFNIRNVYVGSDYLTTNRKITDEFKLIKNSNDNFYGQSKLALSEASTYTLLSTDKLLVEFDYFEHSRSGGIGFFSVDSYPIDPNEATTNAIAIATAQIPLYDSTSSGDTYDLRNTIDFRPRHGASANDSILVATATTNPSSNTTFDIDSDGSYVPVVNKNFTSDMMFYLPRRDRVVIGKDGKKKVIQGIPSQNPITPEAPAETMSLSTLDIPAYPSLSLENAQVLGRVDQAVRVKPTILKRFTMSDIKGIEERVDRLEYYTSLNVLEKSASQLKIPDSSGLDRFKNGIFVDNFFGHDGADLTDPAYAASIDTEKGELRPSFEVQSIDHTFTLDSNTVRKGPHTRLDISSLSVAGGFQIGDVVYQGASLGTATAVGTVRHVANFNGLASATSLSARVYLHSVTGTFTASTAITNNTRGTTATVNTVLNSTAGDLATVKFSHSEYISQPFATIKANAVERLMFNWNGNVSLSPSSDSWVSLTTTPDNYSPITLDDSWKDITTAWNSDWGNWDKLGKNRTVRVTGVDPIFGYNAASGVYNISVQKKVLRGTRDGINLNSLRDKVIPYIKAQKVSVTVTGLKPNTRIYAFFDGINVTRQMENSSFVGRRPPSNPVLVTDSNGKWSGYFKIPNNRSLKFRTGIREFVLTDATSLTDKNRSTTATTKFTAVGQTVYKEKGGAVFTRPSQIISDAISTGSDAISTSRSPKNASASIAQSFTVGDFEFKDLNINENPFGVGADGVFISAVDLYFAKKNSTYGVSIEIREVENGLLTARQVPFGYKRLDPDDINVDATTGKQATPFYFDSPVYLRGNQEYAIVVKPDGLSPDYQLWTATLGQSDISDKPGERVTQQPGVGVLFTSSNDSTFTPLQNQDMKFTLWRASFDKTVSGNITYVNEADEFIDLKQLDGTYEEGEPLLGESIVNMTSFSGNSVPLKVGDSISFGSNSGIVRHIIDNGSTATFKADLNGTFPNGATVSFSSAAGSFTGVSNTLSSNTTTGTVQFFDRAGGLLIVNESSGNYTSNTSPFNGFYRGQYSNATSQATNIRDFNFNVLVPKFSYARYIDNEIAWSAKTTSNAYAIATTFDSVEALNDNIFLDEEKVLAGRTSEVNNTSGNKTLSLKATFSTDVDRTSPVVDLGAPSSVVVARNIVNNDNSSEFGNYGKAKARYISKKVVLADGQEAEDLRVILTAYKPSGTELDVYARFQNEEDSDSFSDKHYTKLTQSTNTLKVSSPTVEDDYVEYEYQVPTSNTTSLSAYLDTANNNILRYSNDAGTVFRSYKSFSLKIVMRATGSNVVPRVKDLRAIALQV